MNLENDYKLIHCAGCAQYPCSVSCKNTALAFSRGDLIIESAKCAGCKDAVAQGAAKQGGIPACIAQCKHSGEKAIITIIGVESKRAKAVCAMA
jgi:hypothetical protein